MRHTSILGFVFMTQACLVPRMASVGTIPLLDDKLLAKVNELGDAALVADANRLPRSPRAGTGEYHASLCFKLYVDARYAEHRLATAPPDDPMVKSQLEGEAMSYASCASTCQSAVTHVRSSYRDVAATYQPRCAQASAGLMAKIYVDAVDRSVAKFRDAPNPLERYHWAQQSELALQQASAQAPNDARLAPYAGEIEALAQRHAAEIAKARAFVESAAARDNRARRDTLDTEIRSIEADMKAIRDEQEALNRNGSLDAYMAKRELDDRLRGKEHVIEAKRREIANLEEAYRRLAIEAGVMRARTT